MKLCNVEVYSEYLNFNFCFVNSDGVLVQLRNCLFGSVVSDFLSVFRDFMIVDIVFAEDEVKICLDFTDVTDVDDLMSFFTNILNFSGYEVLHR